MNTTICSLCLLLLAGVMDLQNKCHEGYPESKIELRAVYDLPQKVSTNTTISIERRKGQINMNLIYEIYTEWYKPYQTDKQSSCIISDGREYNSLWAALFNEDVFKLETIDYQGDDYLLYSSPPGIPSTLIHFSFSFGEKKKDYSCLDIEKIVGDKRYLNVFRLLKNFIEKHHCDQTMPDWLTKPFRERPTKTE